MIFVPKYQQSDAMVEVDGSLSIVKTNSGIVTQELYIPNTVVALGKNYIAKRMYQDSGTTSIMKYMGLGLSSAADVDSLANELPDGVNYSRVDMTGAGGSISVTGTSNQIVYVATFGTDNPNTDAAGYELVEAGIFDSATRASGVMLCRTTFPIVTKVQGDTITITWTITIG